jgi:hypothetical protein
MTKAASARDATWEVAVIPTPAYVTGGDVPERAFTLAWMSQGKAIGVHVATRADLLDDVMDSFEEATSAPKAGKPHRPTRIIAKDAALAESLRAVLPGDISIEVGATPDADRLRAEMLHNPEALPSLPEESVTVELAKALFSAAKALFLAHPWRLEPAAGMWVQASAPALGFKGALNFAPSIVGGLGMLVAPLGPDEQPTCILSLRYELLQHLPEARQSQIAQGGWDLISEEDVPHLHARTKDEEIPATGEHYGLLATLARAVIATFTAGATDAIQAARAGKGDFERTSKVTSPKGEIEVRLTVLEEQTDADGGELMAALAALEDSGEVDLEAKAAIEEQLFTHLAQWEEGLTDKESHAFRVVEVASLFVKMVEDYFGATIATLAPGEVRELVFEVLPKALRLPPADVPDFVDRLVVFFSFLEGELGFTQAAAYRQVVEGDGVVSRLKDAFTQSARPIVKRIPTTAKKKPAQAAGKKPAAPAKKAAKKAKKR